MVRNYRIRNRYYKGSKLSEAQFLRLIFPILIGASYTSISEETGLSEYRIRTIAHALRMRFVNDSIWMQHIYTQLHDRLVLLRKKDANARMPSALHVANVIHRIFNSYWVAHTAMPSLREKQKDFGRDIRLENQQAESAQKLSYEFDLIDACLTRCPIGPSVREMKSEYGSIDVLALNRAFKNDNYETSYIEPYRPWIEDPVITKYIKRPLQGLDSRIENRSKNCDTCPAKVLSVLSAADWLLFSNYCNFCRNKPMPPEMAMGFYFQALIAPAYFDLYLLMHQSCRHIGATAKDEDQKQHNNRWIKEFREKMQELENEIISITAKSLFLEPLQNTGKPNV
jgi:hypothetical protein